MNRNEGKTHLTAASAAEKGQKNQRRLDRSLLAQEIGRRRGFEMKKEDGSELLSGKQGCSSGSEGKGGGDFKAEKKKTQAGHLFEAQNADRLAQEGKRIGAPACRLGLEEDGTSPEKQGRKRSEELKKRTSRRKAREDLRSWKEAIIVETGVGEVEKRRRETLPDVRRKRRRK